MYNEDPGGTPLCRYGHIAKLAKRVFAGASSVEGVTTELFRVRQCMECGVELWLSSMGAVDEGRSAWVWRPRSWLRGRWQWVNLVIDQLLARGSRGGGSRPQSCWASEQPLHRRSHRFSHAHLTHDAQFPETLSDEILTKMHAAPKETDVPEFTTEDLTKFDGFIFGYPTRYDDARVCGIMLVQPLLYTHSASGAGSSSKPRQQAQHAQAM